MAQNSPVLVAAFYRFAPLQNLQELRAELQQLGGDQGVLGTVLLAAEGVNGTVCGKPEAVSALLDRLRLEPGFEALEEKRSWCDQPCFLRFKVRLKAEIVTMGCQGVDPTEQVGTYVPPEQWNELIADPTTLVIDTRNSYEVGVGSFAGAVDPQTESFREFPAWAAEELRPLMQARGANKLALFCTGGIRCEKATAHLLQQGFDQVHHLEGGILRYLEMVPPEQSRWQGECFVFDRRVALNHQLQPGEHKLCHACGLPLTPQQCELPSYVKGVSCVHCIERFSDADRERFAQRQQQLERGDIWRLERGDECPSIDEPTV